MTTIYVLSYLIMIGIISLNLSKNCGLGLSWYSKPDSENLKNNENINFFAIGDIQNNNSANAGDKEKWDARKKGTNHYIDAVNDLSNKIKTNNTNNMDFSKLSADDKELFMNIYKDDIIGLINPGDCVQNGNEDGRLHKANSIGAYEYAFNNNPEDGGLLDVPSYECLGNHDHDLGSTVVDKILYLDGKNPTVDMQNRRNNYRRHIVHKDEHGNYSCDWGKLHMIFINIWPSNEKLLTGDPTGSLEFLEKDLKIHGHKKWMIVTHYIPILEMFSIHYGGKAVMADFGKIYEQYKDTSLGGLCGHEHLLRGKYRTTYNKFKHHILPGPADYYHKHSNTIIEIPLFSFNQTTQKNTLFKIMAERGKDYIVHKVY